MKSQPDNGIDIVFVQKPTPCRVIDERVIFLVELFAEGVGVINHKNNCLSQVLHQQFSLGTANNTVYVSAGKMYTTLSVDVSGQVSA